jgi:hypothetical protein
VASSPVRQPPPHVIHANRANNHNNSSGPEYLTNTSADCSDPEHVPSAGRKPHRLRSRTRAPDRRTLMKLPGRVRRLRLALVGLAVTIWRVCQPDDHLLAGGGKWSL